MTGLLYVVATPIGNLEDISARAIKVLSQVNRIAAEDTRHSSRLLQHLGINTPLVAVHDHNEAGRVQSLIDQLLAGDSIALISDAGTPLISDPGYRLVAAAHQANIQVVPVVGACAAIAALSAAGLPSDRFSFEGFLAAKTSQRQTQLKALANESRTLIFYEAPHRIVDCINDMIAVFGVHRQITLARELTKVFETFHSDNLGNTLQWLLADENQQKGEFVLLLPSFLEENEPGLSRDAQHTVQVLMKELPLKQAVQLAVSITGEKKKSLYAYALSIKND